MDLTNLEEHRPIQMCTKESVNIEISADMFCLHLLLQKLLFLIDDGISVQARP